MIEKLPGLPDAELKNLLANAQRLEQEGTAQQKASASSLLPAINAELSARKAAKQVKAQEARAAKRKAAA
jgi:hypothetical protein